MYFSSLTPLLFFAGGVWAQNSSAASMEMDSNSDMGMSKTTSPTAMMATGMSSTSESTFATTITDIDTTSKSTSTDIDPISKSTSTDIDPTSKSTSTSKTTITISTTATSYSTSTSTTTSMTTSMTTPKSTTIFSTITSLITKSSTVMTTPLITTSKTTAVLVVTSLMTSKPATTSMMMATAVTTSKTAVTTMPATVSVQIIQVSTANGTGALTFTPNSVTAAVGSLVQFQFHPMNHSVVQADFNRPCIPINSVTPAVKGIFSGFQLTTGVTTPIFTILINDTTPIWYYCSQAMHCQAGMVGVINPRVNETIAQFTALAKMATQNLSPVQVVMNTTTAMNTTKVNTTATMTAPLNVQTHAGVGSIRHSLLGISLAGLIALIGMAAL